jgi:hypothetical protein
MVKGTDYTLDPYTGELMFSPGTIIGELDTIAVSFETYGYNQSVGTLNGWRADLSAIKGTHLGFTYMTQNTPNNSNSSKTKTDQFYGYNNAQTPYILQFPVDMIIQQDSTGKIISAMPRYPMQAYIGPDLKVYGKDFVVDPNINNEVYFAYPIPSTQLVKITYTPQIIQNVPGNRNVWGVDSSFMLGKTGSLTAEMASSHIDMTTGPVNGNAWQLRSNLGFLSDKLHVNAYLRNIGSDYSAIESPGFQTNERGLTMDMDYQISNDVHMTATWEKTRRPDYNYSTTTGTSSTPTVSSLDDFSQMNMSLSWRLGKGGQFNLNHTGMKTLLGAGGESTYSTDNVAFNYNMKSLNMDLSLGRNTNTSSSYYTSSAGAATGAVKLSSYGTDSLNTRLNLRWRTGRILTLSSIVSQSSIKSNSGTNNNATDMSLTADINPMNKLRVKLSYEDQNSGNSSLFGTSTSTIPTTPTTPTGGSLTSSLPGSTNYLGGGINSNLGGYGNYSGSFMNSSYNTYNSSSFAGKSKSINMSLSYQPVQKLSLDMSWSHMSSAGDYLYNSQQNNITLSSSYIAGDNLMLNASLSSQNVQYLGSSGGSNSTMMYLNMRAKPWGKLTTTLSYQNMISNSNLVQATTPVTSGGYSGNPFYNGGVPITGGGTTTTPTNLNTNLNSYSLRLEYPVWMGNNLYTEYDLASSGGYLASDQHTFLCGMDFGLTNNLHFTLGWRNQVFLSKDTTSGSSSYSVNSLDADLSAHF